MKRRSGSCGRWLKPLAPPSLRRWTLLICYNRVDNDTIVRDDDRYYVPLDVVDDDALRRAGPKFAARDNAEHFTSRPYVPEMKKVA